MLIGLGSIRPPVSTFLVRKFLSFSSFSLYTFCLLALLRYNTLNYFEHFIFYNSYEVKPGLLSFILLSSTAERMRKLAVFCLLCFVSVGVMMVILYGQHKGYLPDDQMVLSTESRTTDQPQFYFELDNITSFIQKRDKLMFLKTHKCGTSSLVTILYQFGIRRNLNFLLTPYEHQFFNDKPPQKLAPGQDYDILCQHHRGSGAWDYYRPWIVHKLLPKEQTFYFTILRNPNQQFLSNYFFYNHQDRLKKKFQIKSDSVDEVLQQSLAQLPNDSLTCNSFINPMSFDLGFTHILQKNKGLNPDVLIVSFIRYLDREFDLVMITNEFDKSLLLLKHYLGWRIDDVVYLKKMTRSLDDSAQPIKPIISEKTLNLLRFHNRVDMKVFEYFEQKFTAQIGTLEKKQFEADLETLQEKQTELVSQCLNMSHVIKTHLGTVYHPLSNTGRMSNSCRLWTLSDVFISKSLAAKQDPTFSEDSFKAMKLKNVKYGTIVNHLKLLEGIRSDYLRSSGTS